VYCAIYVYMLSTRLFVAVSLLQERTLKDLPDDDVVFGRDMMCVSV
jgi:hypothetical protein